MESTKSLHLGAGHPARVRLGAGVGRTGGGVLPATVERIVDHVRPRHRRVRRGSLELEPARLVDGPRRIPSTFTIDHSCIGGLAAVWTLQLPDDSNDLRGAGRAANHGAVDGRGRGDESRRIEVAGVPDRSICADSTIRSRSDVVGAVECATPSGLSSRPTWGRPGSTTRSSITVEHASASGLDASFASVRRQLQRTRGSQASTVWSRSRTSTVGHGEDELRPDRAAA